MLKKICITASLLMAGAVCCAAEPAQKPAKTMPNAVIVVRSELSRYNNLSNLKKAQLLVSHPDIETETKLRRNKFIGAKDNSIPIMFNRDKSVKINNVKPVAKPVKINSTKPVQVKKSAPVVKVEPGKLTVLNKEENLTKAIERVQAERKVKHKKAPVIETSGNSLKAELEKSRASEMKLRRENNAMKAELKKNIEAMEKYKSLRK